MPEGNGIILANANLKCNEFLGQLNLKINNSPNAFDTINFRCNQPAGHLDACRFEGSQVTVFRKRP